MKYIVLSDTHFGIKQNSITWMHSQIDFIYNELIPTIKSLKDDVYIIHCGDVFDSRSSINPMIAVQVRKAFSELAKITKGVYIIGGNHDYYSPNDDSISALQLTLGNITGVNLITNHYEFHNGSALVPWYTFEDKSMMEEIISKHPDRIFCHTDLIHLSQEYRNILSGIPVYSGHIHTPHRDGQLITLGSTFALTFADSNAERGYHIIDTEKNTFKFVAARNIIKFWRFHNEEIFSVDTESIKNDYVELYIDKLNLLNDRYTEQISEITTNVKNVVVIPNTEIAQVSEVVEFTNYDIAEICRKNIPDELKDKFNQISSLS